MAKTYLSDDEVFGSTANGYLDESEVLGGGQAPEEKGKLRKAAEFVGDTAVDLAKGGIGLGESVIGVADLVTGNTVGKGWAELGYRPEETKKFLNDFYSDERNQANQAVADAKGFMPTVDALISNPRAAFGSVAESSPMMLGGAAVVREAAVKMLAARGIAAGTAEAAAFLAKPEVVAKLTALGSASEGAMTAGNIQEQGRQAGRDYLDTAPQAVAGGAITGLIGAATSKIPGFRDAEVGAATAGMGGAAQRTTLLAAGKDIAKSTFKEGVLEELPQSAQEQVWTNLALGKPWDQGVAEAAAQGMVAGAGMGGGMSTYTATRNGISEAVSPKPEAQPAPSAAPQTAVADGAAQVPQPSPQQSEGEKALYETKSLTALDRVNELDAERTKLQSRMADLADPANGYGEMFDQERDEVAGEMAKLDLEREGITKSWPKMMAGKSDVVRTDSGAEIPYQWALVPIDEEIRSHDSNLRENEIYPKEMQPRDRTRASSATQSAEMRQKYDPARAGWSPDIQNGAPIISRDGVMLSGNMRGIVQDQIISANGQKAEDLRNHIINTADQYGFTQDQVREAFSQNPRLALRRVLSSNINRAEFARQANASTVAQMSAGEQAKSDAARMDILEDLRPDDNGDFSTSREFIRRFMSKLPGTEQAGMIDAAGNLSQSGYARIRNAVLAKAYGESPVLQRMTESMDDNLRNISKALVKVSPEIAKARQAIKEGALHDADVTPDLLKAIESISVLRSEGKSIHDELAQSGMFGDKYSPETRELMEFLDQNIRSPRKMADFLKNITEALAAAGNPGQGSMFGDSAPQKGDLINFAKGQQNGRENAPAYSTAGEDRRQSEAKDGNQTGNQANRSSTSEGTSDWVAFPADTGTLGIPRAEMPQVKSNDRGAFIQFLQGRGVSHKSVELDADDIKPTQAEYSPSKTASWANTGDSNRSVLISSDGYVLDGHHQWMAAHMTGEKVQAIRLSVPIRRLLNLTNQFPSVQRSEGATSENLEALRATAEEDFRAAMADLGAILRKHSGARMIVEEDYPDLVPTLVKLFESAFKLGYYNLKDAIKYVKAELRKDSKLKAVANFIKGETLNKAAQEGFKNFEAAKEASAKAEGQADMFSAPAKPRNAITVDGNEYDADAPNFGMPAAPRTLKDGDPLLVETDKKGDSSMVMFDDMEMPRAEMHRQIIDHYFRDAVPVTGRKPISYVMGGGGASGKGKIKNLLISQGVIKDKGAVSLDPDEIKPHIPEYDALIAAGDSRAAAVVHEESSTLSKKIKARAIEGKYDLVLDVTLGGPAKGVKYLEELKAAGYDVRLYGVTVDPATAVVRATERAKRNGRWVPLGELLLAHKGFVSAFEKYAEIADQALLYENTDSAKLIAQKDENELSIVDRVSYNEIQERGKLNESANTLSQIGGTKGDGLGRVGSRDSENAGRSESPLRDEKSRTEGRRGDGSSGGLDQRSEREDGQSGADRSQKGGLDENGDGKSGADGAQGKESVAAQGTSGQRQAKRVRSGSSGSDSGRINDADNGDSAQERARQGQDDGRRGRDSEDVASAGRREGTGRAAGVPAGRDIPLKSGRNYQFGPDDLTYDGGWQKKAVQNVEAVELVKKLESEGRQATPEEQKVLAKFIGWGSSEIANSIFGDKLDKQLEAIKAYEAAIEAMGDASKVYRNGRGHYQAFTLLKEKNPSLNYYGNDTYEITREQLLAAKPDMGAKKWADMRDRLKAVMTESEWKDASRSTQYAHYTSKPVVQSMMKMLSRMGFKGGAILEPGAGIGVFPGLMPSEMAANSVYTGIEFDPTTGGILKQLFPDERILVESFIDSKLPADYYDVGFGNPPFGDIPILSDPKYKKHGFLLHDYFFAKSIDSVKPGGLVVYVTSNGTMDKRGDKARSYLAERADLVGAIRMPQTAFKKNAGTEVVTDVLVLRKKVKGEQFPHAQEWLKSVPIKVGANEFSINEYFHAHPEMVLGEHSSAGSMYAKESYTVMPKDGDIDAQFDAAANSLPANIFAASRGSAAEAAKVRELDFNPKAKKDGNYYVSDAGVLMVREGGVGARVDGKSEKDLAMLKDFVGLRDALKQAHYDQLNDGEWEKSLAALQKAYKDFTDKHGQINQFTTYQQRVKVDELDEEGTPTGQKVWDEEQRYRYPMLAKLRDDPDWTLAAALESINEDAGTISPSPFLTERVLGKPERQPAATPTDALLQTLNDLGHVDMGVIADSLGITEQDAINALGPLVYQDPSAGWVMADEYLSGNVRAKLRTAKEAVKSDRQYERNVEALLTAQPADKTASDIKPQLGMAWIPENVYEQFLRDKANLATKVTYNERTGQWDVAVVGGIPLEATQDWGTDKRNAADILQHALTGTPIRITTTVGTGSDRKTVFDDAGTEAANAKLNQMREAFADWLWTDKGRVDSLVPLYNEKFNNIVPRKFDGSHMTLPGISKRWNVFDHVKRGAWRIIQSGNTYLAHAVGSGKTFQMIISAMEQKRLGLIKKPMMVVPNHMLQQFAREWQDLYPAARLMVADEANFTGDNRRRFVARVATSDLDGVIITHSAFKLLDLDPEYKQKVIEQELDFLRAAMLEAGGTDEKTAKGKSKNRDPKVKQIEKKIERMEEKLKAAMSAEGKDKNVRFDETGVDMLYVDEAHEYRKLGFTTQRQVKGVDSNGSDKAFDLHMKVQWLRENKNPERTLVMASGTPVTNTMAEIYSVQRFMAPDVLADRGLEEFDQWASMFGSESTSIEPDASGKYGPVTRFNKFVNVGELTQMFREFADVLTSDYLAALLGDKRPKVRGGSRNIAVTPKTAEYSEFQENQLKPRMEASRKWKPSREEPNNPDPIIAIIGDGRLAAIDMRFMDPSLPSNPDSKLNRMIDGVIASYKETAGLEYKEKDGNKVEPNKGATQIVFSDLGFGAGVTAHRGFNARAWFEKRLRDAGVNPAHVAFMSDNKKSASKLKLFRDINAGRVRIVVGSSKNMGTGVNAQQRLYTLHHLDAPWYPADLEQREGRIVRQGNKNPVVELKAYATKGSYDEQMWSTLARKQFFIDQALSGDPNIREIEDLGEASQMDMAAAMVADDPRVLQLAGIKSEIDKLRRLERAHEEQKARMRQDYNLAKLHIDSAQGQLPEADKAAALIKNLSGDNFVAEANGKRYSDRKEFGTALLAKYKELSDKLAEKPTSIGKISGFDLTFAGQMNKDATYLTRLVLMTPDPVVLAESPAADPVGVALRAANALSAAAKKPAELRARIADGQSKMNAIEPRLNTPFSMKEMLITKQQEAEKLESEIVASGKENVDQELIDKAKEAAPAFARGSAGTMSVPQLTAAITRLTSRLKNAPPLNVVQSAKDLPFDAPNDARGAFWKGSVWMVADNIESLERAREVYSHETMGHYGLRGFFGPALDKHLQAIFNANKRVRMMVMDWKGRNADLIKTYKSQYRMSDADVQAIAIEEAMAQIAQKGEKITGVKRLVNVIQQMLRSLGMRQWADRLEAATDAEALTALAKAEMFVRDGRKLSGWAPRGFAPAMMAQSLEDDLAEQEKFLMAEAKKLGYKDIEDLLVNDYSAFEKLAAKWREMNPADALYARAADDTPLADRVNAILSRKSGTPAPVDAIAKAAVKMVRFDRLTGKVGEVAGRLLDRLTPEQVKSGMISDYGVPENVIDRRAMLAGHLNVQTRKAGALLDKLSALTREESRVAYLWMNNNDPQAADFFEKQLPEKSVEALKEIKGMIEKLSREAVDLKQLDPESYKRNTMEYLRRSYKKYTLNLEKGEAVARASAIKVLGDQYKGRGFEEEAEMSKVKAAAPEWWNRKLQAGKADKQLKGEKFLRLERHAHSGEGTVPMDAFGDRSRGKLLEVAYWPAGEPIPTKYAGWDEAGTFEVRDTKGGKVVFWRDYTAAERQAMGEIDEARFAIAKTLHGMIHDIEIGRYLDWVAKNYSKLVQTPEMGEILEGRELGWNTGMSFTKDQWIKVPDTKVAGTDVAKYGALAGRYLPAPIWNDVRQAHGQVKPFGETYSKLLRMWKMSKTALSPAVHTNNVMSNFVMADWHDVTAGHVNKALRIILAAHKRDGKALIGRAGNLAARAGIADVAAAQAIMDRYQDSGGAIGTWASKELMNDQISPLLEALEKEAGLHGQSADVDVGVFSAMQHLMHARFKDAFTAIAGSKPGKYVGAEGQNLLDLYQAEDDVFRLAAWLKSKEDGASDMAAGKVSRKSFLDYSINAPWVQMMRNTGLPFISYTYRAIPMLLAVAQTKPWKLMKLAAFAGGLNALGYLLSGGDEDDERKYLPEEKAGKIWGAVPKLIRMPWNDAQGSPVFLDVRRFVPVGDVFDVGQTNGALPIPPAMMPGGPLVMLMEVLLNKSAFTGKDISLETDTLGEKIAKSADHLWKGMMPNILGLPGTYATAGVVGAAKGKTDAFGRELSVTQALGNTVGIKVGAYPKDVLQMNATKKLKGEEMEIDHQINKLKREYQKKGMTYEEFMDKVRAQQDKKRNLIDKFQQRGQ